MNPKDQELMERYIYQVVRRLPKEQRGEVGLELQELIGDMMEESDSMEEVLTKLGDPAEFAKKYQDMGHYLIGPEYFDNYIWFLKIVLLCTLIPVLIAAVVEGIREGTGRTVLKEGMAVVESAEAVVRSVVYGIANGIANIVISCIGVFGGVTLMFAVMERNKVRFDMKKQKEWSVSDLGDNFAGKKNIWSPNYLAPIPHKKAVISRGDSIASIIFIVIFCVLLILAPQFFAAVFRDNEVVTTIPLFNLEQWHIIMPVFVLSLVVSLADEIFRLVVGHYCKAVMICNIVCGFIEMVLCFIVLKVFPFWNPDFAAQVKIQLNGESDVVSGFFASWDGNFISNCLLTLCVVITVAEVATTVYKTLRYGIDKNKVPLSDLSQNNTR